MRRWVAWLTILAAVALCLTLIDWPLVRPQERPAVRVPTTAPAPAPRPAPLPGRCSSAEIRSGMDRIAPRREAGEMFVDPEVWDSVDFQTRSLAARWFSECEAGGKTVSIRHGMTGRVLARHHPRGGYVSEE